MRYRALATDYDGTLATHGKVDDSTLAALGRLRRASWRLVLVTGREMPSLARAFPRLELFDSVVAENGALLYEPVSGREELLGEAPPERLVRLLRERGVAPMSVGKGIIATEEPHEVTVLEAIRELGLEWHVIFNKGWVMALPTGVTKASGLQAALARLGVPAAEAVAVGDAENDHAMLQLCGFGCAVANAIPALKERAHYVTAGERGAGVTELIERMLAGERAPAG